VEICAAGDKLDGCGMLVDFSELKKVVDEWDHQCLNEIVPVNPTAENLAELLLKKLSRERGFPVTSVTLWESPGASVAACSE
jgi:6-pyruvoyltetrahydropterin/6-carboxytetrahydropterin synthase